MDEKRQPAYVQAEHNRIEAEYRRRELEVRADLYAPWQPAAMLMSSGRRRAACKLLKLAGVFPNAEDHCLEIGFGSVGWLGDLISWGVRESSLHGIELDASRARRARLALPVADLRVGDAVDLPWAGDTFKLVVASTVFTSILDSTVRSLVADQITRVLAPGGALLWYDFAFDNPMNPNVKGVSRRELRRLFPMLRGRIRSVTLAPPLARLVTSWSWVLATLLEGLPVLRTHLIAVLVKPPRGFSVIPNERSSPDLRYLES